MKYPVYIIGFLFLFLCYCNQPEQKFHKSELIPAKDLVPLLTDFHLTDGLLSLSEVRQEYEDMDSLVHYLSILASYGYSLNQLNNTIEHYSHNPDALDEIYEKVIIRLTEMEGEIKSSEQEKEKTGPT